jgi:hypothetical protein
LIAPYTHAGSQGIGRGLREGEFPVNFYADKRREILYRGSAMEGKGVTAVIGGVKLLKNLIPRPPGTYCADFFVQWVIRSDMGVGIGINIHMG